MILSFIRPALHGHTERREYVTSVVQCLSGEYRDSVRMTPRIVLSYNYHLNDQHLHEIKRLFRSTPYMDSPVPLWHQVGDVGAVSAGATSLPIETAHREFVVGAYAVINERRTDRADVGEIVKITAISSSNITVQPLSGGYVDATVCPALPGYLTTQLSITKSRPNNHEAQLTWHIDDYKLSASIAPAQYLGNSVLTQPPMQVSALHDHIGLAAEQIDGKLGAVAFDPAETYARNNRLMTWQCSTLEQQQKLRQWLDHCMGKARAFWSPTFNDLGIISGSGNAFTFRLAPLVNSHLAFHDCAAFELRKVNAVAGNQVTLDAALTISPKRVCEVNLMRFDADNFGIHHDYRNASLSAPMIEVIDV